MANSAATAAYEELSLELLGEEGVTASPEGMLVHSRVFVFPAEDDLVVDLPPARARDLVDRGVATPYTTLGEPTREWVRVGDIQLWPELSREAHEYVGEPPVGGDS